MLSLRPHQQDVVDKIDAGFNEGHRCQLLYAPTGFGKTEVAMAIMREVSRKYKRTAMMLDRIVLVNQTSARLSSYGIDHGVMQADHWRYKPHERIQIVSAQTLEKRAKKLDIDLLIIDECHVQRASIVKLIKANPDLKVIGLTATPFTKGLGNVYTNIVGAKATGELIKDGWLTPLRVFIAKEIDMTGVTKVAGEWAQDQVTERGMKITGDIVTSGSSRPSGYSTRPSRLLCSVQAWLTARISSASSRSAGLTLSRSHTWKKTSSSVRPSKSSQSLTRPSMG